MSDAGTSHARLLSRTNMATGAQCRMPLAQKVMETEREGGGGHT